MMISSIHDWQSSTMACRTTCRAPLSGQGRPVQTHPQAANAARRGLRKPWLHWLDWVRTKHARQQGSRRKEPVCERSPRGALGATRRCNWDSPLGQTARARRRSRRQRVSRAAAIPARIAI